MTDGAKKPVRRLRNFQPRAQSSLWGREPGLRPPEHSSGLPAALASSPPHSRPGVSCDLLDDLAVNLVPEVLLPAQLWGQEGQVGRAGAVGLGRAAV